VAEPGAAEDDELVGAGGARRLTQLPNHAKMNSGCGQGEMMEVHVQASPLDDRIPAEQRGIFARWAAQMFTGNPLARQLAWTDQFAYQVVVYLGSVPVSYLRIVDRAGLVDGQPLRMGGVADVMTPHEHRRKGYAGLAVEESQRVIFDLIKARLGLLFCAEELLPFYVRYGWQAVDCPVTMEQSDGRQLWPQRTMILPRPGETWAPHSIDICGLPW